MNGEREGKPTIQKYQVGIYPCLADTTQDGELISKTTGITDGDKTVSVLARDLPEEDQRRLEADQAAHPGDVHSLAVLMVVRAERGDIEAATHLCDLLTAAGGTRDGLAATDHALGAAFYDRGNDLRAAMLLQDAVAAATDPREVVALHFQLAECALHLHKNADAVAEWEWVRHRREATGDERKDAESREEHLLKALH